MSWNRLRPSGRPARSRRIRQDRKFGCSDPTDVRAARIQTAGPELHQAAADPLLSVLYVPHATATPPSPPPVAEGSTNNGAGITTTGAATATDPSFPVEVQTEFFVTACPRLYS